MSFVDRFYSFIIELSAADRNIFEKIRLKLPKYPQEETSSMVDRVLVYLHNYSSEISFSPNPAALDTPTLFSRDNSEGYLKWIFIGVPDLKALRLNTRRFENAQFSVYFINEIQIERFCHALRGTKENWVKTIHFFLITSGASAQLADSLASSAHWYVNQTDDTFFMESDGVTHQIDFTPIDIWQSYQESLLTHAKGRDIK